MIRHLQPARSSLAPLALFFIIAGIGLVPASIFVIAPSMKSTVATIGGTAGIMLAALGVMLLVFAHRRGNRKAGNRGWRYRELVPRDVPHKTDSAPACSPRWVEMGKAFEEEFKNLLARARAGNAPRTWPDMIAAAKAAIAANSRIAEIAHTIPADERADLEHRLARRAGLALGIPLNSMPPELHRPDFVPSKSPAETKAAMLRGPKLWKILDEEFDNLLARGRNRDGDALHTWPELIAAAKAAIAANPRMAEIAEELPDDERLALGYRLARNIGVTLGLPMKSMPKELHAKPCGVYSPWIGNSGGRGHSNGVGEGYRWGPHLS